MRPQTKELNQLFYQLCDSGSKTKSSEYDYYHQQLLEHIFVIIDKDDAWKKAATQVVTLSEIRLKQDPDAFNTHQNSYNASLLALLDTLYRIDQDNKAKFYLNKSALRLKDRFETLWILILNDRIEEAVNLAKSNLHSMDSPTNFWDQLRKFKIDEKLPKFYSALADKERIYTTKVFAAFASRNSKLQLELVKEFEKENPQNKTLRKALIEAFNKNNKTKVLIKKHNAELFNSVDPLPIIYSDDHNKNESYVNYIMTQISQLSSADLDLITKKIKEARLDNDYAYKALNLVRSFSGAYDQFIDSNAEQLISTEADGTKNGAHYILSKSVLLGKCPKDMLTVIDDCTNVHFTQDIERVAQRLAVRSGVN